MVLPLLHGGKSKQVPWDIPQPKSLQSQLPTFNFLFMNKNGSLTSYVVTKHGLQYDWKFKVPFSQNDLSTIYIKLKVETH